MRCKAVLLPWLTGPLLAALAGPIGCGSNQPPAATASTTGITANVSTVASGVAPPAATAYLPFKIELVEVQKSSLPALHSSSAASADGKWLILGGRVVGLHGFGSSPTNFPRSSANTMAYVIDPAANTVLGSVDLVKALKPKLAGPLTATNQEFVQVGTSLYVVGGYGRDLQTGKNATIGSLVRVDVPGLIKAITTAAPIASFFAQSPGLDNRLKVSGGALKYASNVFYLVFGQDFAGDYSVQNRDYNRAGGQFQKYTEKIRAFTLNPDLSIKDFNLIDGGYDPNLPYHRRDLNVVDIIESDGITPGAMVYGGVFLAGQVGGHTSPIEVGFSSTPATVTAHVFSGFKQALNHYDCAHVTLFDQASSTCYTTLFGGISQYHYDSKTGTLVRDALNLPVDGLPFIDTISTIGYGPNSAFSQYIQPTPLPGLIGTDAHFLADPDLESKGQVYPNGVIKLAGLTGKTLVGYMYGGIESAGSYSGLVTDKNPPTWASSRLFQIYVTPERTAVIPMPPIPSGTTPYPPK
ncbi:MAG TPA: hypothetical protein VKT78_19915 [Fimbriimonadaceae bacterium]|nr:hypothetical protein [Fimbriimonadaceae bacterium]